MRIFTTALFAGAVALTALAGTAYAENPMVGGAPMYADKNIVENAVNSKDHTTLVAAVKAAGEPLKSAIVDAYANSLAPVFWYLVPILAVALLLALVLKEIPLSEHAGMVARGEADLYPRVGPTSEWDTAAGHAVLAAAGGAVTRLDGAPLLYGNAERRFENPDFVAWGRGPLARKREG